MRKISFAHKRVGSSVSLVLLIGAASLSGCGSGGGTAPIPGFSANGTGGTILPTPIPVTTPTPTGVPTPAPSGSPTPTTSPTPGTPTNFTAQDLGLPSGTSQTTTLLNLKFNNNGQNGQVAALSGDSDGVPHVVLYSNGAYQFIETSTNTPVSVGGVSDRGSIVGAVSVSGTFHPFLIENGEFRDLGLLIGDGCFAQAISPSGQIAGGFQRGNYAETGAFFYANGTARDLGHVKSGDQMRANAINDAGQIVGQSTSNRTVTTAFLWDNGNLRDLGHLPGGTSSEARAINNKGQIVGRSSIPGASEVFRAVVFENGTVRDLKVGIDGYDSVATGINDAGQIVGYYDDNQKNRHAFLVSNGTVVDLNPFSPRPNVFNVPVGINNQGQILLSVASADGTSSGTPVLLTPVAK